jgi:hypothetical protein
MRVNAPPDWLFWTRDSLRCDDQLTPYRPAFGAVRGVDASVA